MEPNEVVDTTLLSIGSLYSLVNLEQILGIIILVIQIVWVSYKLCAKIYSKIAHKKEVQITNDEVHELLEVTSEVRDEIKHIMEDTNEHYKG